MPASPAPPPSPVVSAAGRASAAARHHGADSAQAQAARRDLEYAKCRRAVERLVASAPPLTREQLDDLAALLDPGTPG